MRLRPLAALAACLGFLWSATPAHAQQDVGLGERLIVAAHDNDSATPTYCLLEPSDRPVSDKIQASASTTVTAVSGTPFADVAVGAELSVEAASQAPAVTLYVVARASSTSITVDQTVTLVNRKFSFRNLACGTGAGAGWFSVSNWTGKLFVLQLAQVSLGAGSFNPTVECKGSEPWSTPAVVGPPFAGGTPCDTGALVAARTCWLALNDPWSWCRVGVTIATDDGGDTGANREIFTATVSGRP